MYICWHFYQIDCTIWGDEEKLLSVRGDLRPTQRVQNTIRVRYLKVNCNFMDRCVICVRLCFIGIISLQRFHAVGLPTRTEAHALPKIILKWSQNTRLNPACFCNSWPAAAVVMGMMIFMAYICKLIRMKKISKKEYWITKLSMHHSLSPSTKHCAFVIS